MLCFKYSDVFLTGLGNALTRNTKNKMPNEITFLSVTVLFSAGICMNYFCQLAEMRR